MGNYNKERIIKWKKKKQLNWNLILVKKNLL